MPAGPLEGGCRRSGRRRKRKKLDNHGDFKTKHRRQSDLMNELRYFIGELLVYITNLLSGMCDNTGGLQLSSQKSELTSPDAQPFNQSHDTVSISSGHNS